MKSKTKDLTGMALDWAVAKAEGLNIVHDGIAYVVSEPGSARWLGTRFTNCATYSPSTKWGDGGPIIEREKVSTGCDHSGVWVAYSLQNYADERRFMCGGGTPLIAAMRCYVASKLGDETDVPDDLLET